MIFLKIIDVYISFYLVAEFHVYCSSNKREIVTLYDVFSNIHCIFLALMIPEAHTSLRHVIRAMWLVRGKRCLRYFSHIFFISKNKLFRVILNTVLHRLFGFICL